MTLNETNKEEEIVPQWAIDLARENRELNQSIQKLSQIDNIIRDWPDVRQKTIKLSESVNGYDIGTIAENTKRLMILVEGSESLGVKGLVTDVKDLRKEMKDGFDDMKKRFAESEEKSKIDLRIIIKELLSSAIVKILGGSWIVLELIKNWESIEKVFTK